MHSMWATTKHTRAHPTLAMVAPAARPNTTHSVSALPPRRLSPWIPPTIYVNIRNTINKDSDQNKRYLFGCTQKNLASSKNTLNGTAIRPQELSWWCNTEPTLLCVEVQIDVVVTMKHYFDSMIRAVRACVKLSHMRAVCSLKIRRNHEHMFVSEYELLAFALLIHPRCQ